MQSISAGFYSSTKMLLMLPDQDAEKVSSDFTVNSKPLSIFLQLSITFIKTEPS